MTRRSWWIIRSHLSHHEAVTGPPPSSIKPPRRQIWINESESDVGLEFGQKLDSFFAGRQIDNLISAPQTHHSINPSPRASHRSSATSLSSLIVYNRPVSLLPARHGEASSPANCALIRRLLQARLYDNASARGENHWAHVHLRRGVYPPPPSAPFIHLSSRLISSLLSNRQGSFGPEMQWGLVLYVWTARFLSVKKDGMGA